jgi:hypothetical protein
LQYHTKSLFISFNENPFLPSLGLWQISSTIFEKAFQIESLKLHSMFDFLSMNHPSQTRNDGTENYLSRKIVEKIGIWFLMI